MSGSSPSVTSLLDALAGYLSSSNTSAIQSFLTGQGVPSEGAALIAQAVSMANGNAVTLPSVTLGALLSQYLPANANIPDAWSDVTISNVTFTANAQDVSLGLSGTLSLTVTLGESCPFAATLTISSTVSQGTRQTAASLGGDLTFAKSTFNAGYDIRGAGQTLTASWSSQSGALLGMDDVITGFGQTVPQIEQGSTSLTEDVWKTLALKQASLTADLSADATQILLNGQCAIGYAFALLKSGGEDVGWALTCGGSLVPPANATLALSDLPVIGSRITELPSDLGLAITGAVLLVSTGKVANFSVPVPQGGLSPLGRFTPTILPGATVAGVLDLSGSANSPGIAGHIANINSQPVENSSTAASAQLLLEAQLPQLDVKVDLGERNLFKNPPFDFDLSLTLAAVPFSAQLQGSCTLTGGTLNGLEFSASLGITADSVIGDLSADYPSGFNPPLPFLQGLWLYEIGGMMGLDFSKQEVTAGFMGKFLISSTGSPTGSGSTDASGMKALMPHATGSSESSTIAPIDEDEFVVVLGVNDDAGVVPIPDLNLLMLRLTEFDLQDLLSLTLGKDAPSVSSPVLNDLKASDIQIYWCDEVPGTLLLPDGSKPAPGFRFQGAFNFWNEFQAWSNIEIGLDPKEGTSTGFTGQFYVSPVNLGGILQLASDGNNAPPAPVEAAMQAANFRTGGPYLNLDTSGPDFLSASWKATLLKWATTTVNVDVSTSQVTFTIANQDGNNFASDFACTLTNGFTHLAIAFDGYLNGTLTLPVVVAIALGDVTVGRVTDPTITIQAAYSANLVVDVSDPDNMSLTIDGTFTFAGDTRNWVLPHVAIDLNTDPLEDLADLPGILLKEISSQAETVFKDAVEAAGSLIVQYLNKTWDEIESVAEQLYGDIKNTIEHFFGIHQQKRPSIPWLANGAVISAAGATITDPTDPNFNDPGIYWIHNLKRRHIPDSQTLAFLDPNYQTNMYRDGQQNFIANYVATIPRDVVCMPSVQQGAYYEAYNNGKPAQQAYLAIYDQAKARPARYPIPGSPATYLQSINAMPSQPQQLNQPCDPSDIGNVAKSSMGDTCLMADGSGAIDVFFSGIRRHVPDPGTLAILNRSGQVACSFTGIPQGADLVQLANGDVVKTADNPKCYYIQNNQLWYIDANDYMNWGLDNIPVTTVDDQQMSVLSNSGHSLSKNPNS
jgi:hypothetical protein